MYIITEGIRYDSTFVMQHNMQKSKSIGFLFWYILGFEIIGYH